MKIFLFLLISLNISSIVYASRSSLPEIEEKQKRVSSIETLHEIVLRERAREENPRPAVVMNCKRLRQQRAVTAEDQTRKHQKVSQADKNNVLHSDSVKESILNDPAMIQHIFSFLSYNDMRIGCCVSRTWNIALNDEAFLKPALIKLLPSTPEDFGMSRPRFLDFFNTPSLTILDNELTQNVYDIRISGNGAVIYYRYDNRTSGKCSFKHKRYIKYFCSVIDITEDDKMILAHANVVVDGERVHRAVLFKDEESVPSAILPLKDACGMSHDGKVVLGRSLESSTFVLYKQGKIEEILPIEGFISFEPTKLLRDGETILGYGIQEDGVRRAVVWRNGKIEKMPDGFKWLDAKKIRGQNLFGYLNGWLIHYKNGEIQRSFPFLDYSSLNMSALGGVSFINDWPVVVYKDLLDGSSLWIDGNGDGYSMRKIFEKMNRIKLVKDDVEITDISQNNRMIVGWIKQGNSVKPFMRIVPPYLFDKK